MSQQPPERAPARVRVTSPWTDRPRVRPRPTATSEIDAQSEVGEIYLRTLLRAQLRLALSILLILGLTVGVLPLVFTLVPGLTSHHVLGMPVSWGVLAFGCYPVLVLLAWRYVRLAERNERAFARVVERSS
jgi:putative solute:sodium symporter small subunit